ncbi:hypothetical protein FS827_23450 [Agrobacterium vitis]|uniref:hypothetical protein n=1 Tax=Allorhizobium ampelinum TaxID=3025782 RepID=UPI001F21F35D|nr:hypothetical protein [Allorhizobium ampelinum]MCF1464257.1 hypothetical protein [Allorhizobium ampelinum]
MSEDVKRLAVREAISRLELIVSEAEDRILFLIRDQLDIHPQQIAIDYRKNGEQLSKDEKKALGLRSSVFFSRQAYKDLTEEGCKKPLNAHETVLLRATFTYNRYRTLESFKEDHWKNLKGFEGVKYDVMTMNCPWCRKMESKVVQVEDALIFPSEECICETANYGFRAQIDFLADIE